MNRRLYRSRTDSVLGGVAGGVAEYLDVDPSIVRIVWAVLAIITGGIFFVLYIVMWIVVPETPSGMWAPGPGPAAAPAAAPAAEGSAAGTPESAAPPAATEPPHGQPWSSAGYPRRSGRRGGSGGMVFGLILVGLGIWFLLDEYVPWLRADLLWPAGLVVVGLALLAVSMRRNEG